MEVASYFTRPEFESTKLYPKKTPLNRDKSNLRWKTPGVRLGRHIPRSVQTEFVEQGRSGFNNVSRQDRNMVGKMGVSGVRVHSALRSPQFRNFFLFLKKVQIGFSLLSIIYINTSMPIFDFLMGICGEMGLKP